MKQATMNISKTKIIATIGPSSYSKDMLSRLYEGGMSCARINTAHGDFHQYKELIEKIRTVGDVPIMIDVKGPELRVRLGKDLVIKAGDVVEFGFSSGALPFFTFDFLGSISVGDLIYFDDGKIDSFVESIGKRTVFLKFNDDVVLKPNKSANMPGKELDIPSLSQKDIEAISFALKENVSFVALSFARHRKDIEDVRSLLKDSHIGIIAKIENHEGINNIDEIIEVSDGIMIARGDLGIEIGAEQIPSIQKEIIKKCNNAGKISIVATHMLESMITSKVPTRAEVSDVANAVLDGADAVMLSGETASGKYPLESVKTMRRIVSQSEKSVKHNVLEKLNRDVSKKVSSVGYHLAETSGASKIICVTRSGFSARLVSRYRPTAPVLAVTDSVEAYLQMQMVWGVYPVLLAQLPLRLMMPSISESLIGLGIISKSDFAVYLGGIRTLEKNVCNLVEIHNVGNLLEYKEHLIENT